MVDGALDYPGILSSLDSSGSTQASAKRQRLDQGDHSMEIQPGPDNSANNSSAAGPVVHIPKRGARACTACRKGKNRCEGEQPPCRRCQLSGTQCIFEKPDRKVISQPIGPGVERLTRLENQYMVLQSQMIGMQSSLDRILSAVQNQYSNAPPTKQTHSFYASTHHDPLQSQGEPSPPVYPPLPGFAPPPHKYGQYGIPPSTPSSPSDTSEDTLSRAPMNAPIEALQGLANAAAEAAAVSSSSPPRVKKRKRAEPIPRNAFPHAVEKGLIPDAEARELFSIFFSGCHYFIPLFDPSYDTYDSLMERTPWTFDAILAIAAKIKSGMGPLSQAFYKCLEEAQGIARSSLFGPVVKKEAVMGMLLLAAWSTNGWLPSGHAMRMALDLGLNRALEKLAEKSTRQRSDEEERDLVVSARIWLCLYCFDHQMSLGTGRPIVLRDESSIKHCRILLKHPMASLTDVRLISQVELVAKKTDIYEKLAPLNGRVDSSTLSIIRHANGALDKWWADCDELHRQSMNEEPLLREVLASELQYAKLWLVCVALRGVSWDNMPFEHRELAFQAKNAAVSCLSTFLTSSTYRAALRYAVHDCLVTAAFSGLFLLKMANLFPAELDLGAIIGQVEQLARLLSEVAAERYALTLRLMLASLRRKIGTISGPSVPTTSLPPSSVTEVMDVHQAYTDPVAGPQPPFTFQELGIASLGDRNVFNSRVIPLWLQEESWSDLGLPLNGPDGVLLKMGHPNGWMGDFARTPEAW